MGKPTIFGIPVIEGQFFFVCANCKQLFPMGDEREAQAEFARIYPELEFNKTELCILCDDCHEAVQKWRMENMQ